MTFADNLHLMLELALLAIVAWTTILLVPVFGWVVAALVVGPRSRWGRASLVVGRAAAGSVTLVVVMRLVDAWRDELSGGPMGWVAAMLPTHFQWAPREVVLILAGFHAVVFPLLCLTLGMHERGSRAGRPFGVPLADPVAAGLLLAVPLALLAAWEPYGAPDASPVLLDLVAVLPLVLVALAVWTRAERFSLRAQPRAVVAAPEAPAPALDVPAAWRSLGALGPQDKPLVTTSGVDEPETGSAADVAWRFSGGTAAAPVALDALTQACRQPGRGFVVGDLPDPTEHLFLVAVLLRAIRETGLHCLVVSEEPGQLRESVRRAVQASGSWSCGPLVAGEAELREAFAGQGMPAAAFLDVAGLSAGGIRALCGDRRGTGGLWCGSLGLVVVAGIDRGAPLAVTHRMFTLRRLGLALMAAGTRFSALATGMGGTGALNLLEQVFPAVEAREVPLGPRGAAPVRVWTASERFVGAPGDAWARRALQPVAQAGLPVSVGDPGGAFDRRAVEVWGSRVRLVRGVALDGVASAACLDDAWLIAAFRSLANRVPLPGGGVHDALWALADNPVTRFLSRDGNLQNLHRTGQLPPPRPLVGYENRALARAHLRAALREGRQDLESLAGLFGRSLTEEVAGTAVTEHVLRALPGRDGLVRVPVASAPADDRTDPLRGTVTDRVVQVVDVHGGRLVAEVDELVAATRYYPQRIFAVHDNRYLVPAHRYDAVRAQIQVEQVPQDRPLTRPRLHISVGGAEVVQTPHEVRRGGRSWLLATFDLTVDERVDGFDLPDGTTVAYDPVNARYRSRGRGIFFPPVQGAPATGNVLLHLARMVDAVLVSHLLAGEDDIDVVAVGPGLWGDLPAGVVAVDRTVQGIGLAEALDLALFDQVLKWVGAILRGCPCANGCERCTPRDAVAAGPDKGGVLRLLGG